MGGLFNGLCMVYLGYLFTRKTEKEKDVIKEENYQEKVARVAKSLEGKFGGANKEIPHYVEHQQFQDLQVKIFFF